MQVLLNLIVPAVVGLYALLMVVAAIFRPRMLSGPAFMPVFSFPWGKLELGRLGALVFGLVLSGICGRLIARYFGLLP
jgi:hypothetical protein